MANRILAAIERRKADIASALASGSLSEDRIEALRRALDLDAGEHARFQDLKSLACAKGVLTLEEGLTLFQLLGGTPAIFNARDCATKSVLTAVFRELIGREIARA
jgi:hypothetical protein